MSWKQRIDFRLGTHCFTDTTWEYSFGLRSGSVWWFWSGTETRVEVTLLLKVSTKFEKKNVNKFDRKTALSVDFLFRQMTTCNFKSFTYLLIFWRWHSVDVMNDKSAVRLRGVAYEWIENYCTYSLISALVEPWFSSSKDILSNVRLKSVKLVWLLMGFSICLNGRWLLNT